jgi:RNA polymerase sigma factor (TIGR02999 family)
MPDLTQMLNACDGPDPTAAEALLPLVYDQLKQLAQIRMAQMPPGQTVQATVLVNDAYLKLVQQSDREWKNRRHFYFAAAEAMRQIVIDRARRKNRLRHGAGQVRVDLDAVDVPAPLPSDNEMLLALDEALTEFERVDPEKARIVKLKFYVGLTEAEIATELGLGERTVKRHWAYARAWLFERVERLR